MLIRVQRERLTIRLSSHPYSMRLEHRFRREFSTRERAHSSEKKALDFARLHKNIDVQAVDCITCVRAAATFLHQIISMAIR